MTNMCLTDQGCEEIKFLGIDYQIIKMTRRHLARMDGQGWSRVNLSSSSLEAVELQRLVPGMHWHNWTVQNTTGKKI